MAVKYLDNAGTQYLVNKIKAIDGKIPTESQITTMITSALNTYKEGIVTIVESLPQTGEEGKLYLLVDPSDSDVYIVYTWEENAFKRMGSKTFTLTVDSALSATSTNPVQNKVIKSALDGKANSSHTHGSITNDGKLGTASRVVITGTDKKIGISTVTTTQLGYLSGVTSAIQTQLDGKSATGHTHTAGDVAGLATVATTGSYTDLTDKPTINDSTITIQKNGSTVDSFTTNGSAKTINIPVPTKTSDLTNDSGFLTSTDISSKANDSEVLHKAQTETVTGEKTFKKDVKIIDLNANERPGVQFEVNGSFRTFEEAEDALPDNGGGGLSIGGLSIGGRVWSGFVKNDYVKLQNSMSDYVINDITFASTNDSSVIEFNNYYKVKYNDDSGMQTDLRGMLRFELSPYANVEKGDQLWSDPNLYFYAKLDGESGNTILGHKSAHWSKAYINEINCYEIKFGGNSIHDILEHIVSLSYVTHYSSTALTSNSTNSLSIIDNQDSVKVNDKVIDSSGKMFYITSVDLRNNEFEVGSVVDTFAKDSAVSTAQATANSAQQTATTARQQAYVLRYSSTAITDNSTIAYSTLDNTDNIKADDKIIDVDGKIFSIVSVDSDNSTVTVGSALIDLAQVVGAVALPIGSYIQFAGSQAPDGFLVCNGGEISRTTYSALFAVIGTTYGSGDGSTTFNLPNLTDRFLQGSTTSGTVKNAGLPNIIGFFNYNCTGTAKDVTSSGAISCTSGVDNLGVLGGSDSSLYVNDLTFNASNSNSIYNNSATVQPPALTCLICIKY